MLRVAYTLKAGGVWHSLIPLHETNLAAIIDFIKDTANKFADPGGTLSALYPNSGKEITGSAQAIDYISIKEVITTSPKAAEWWNRMIAQDVGCYHLTIYENEGYSPEDGNVYLFLPVF